MIKNIKDFSPTLSTILFMFFANGSCKNLKKRPAINTAMVIITGSIHASMIKL